MVLYAIWFVIAIINLICPFQAEIEQTASPAARSPSPAGDAPTGMITNSFQPLLLNFNYILDTVLLGEQRSDLILQLKVKKVTRVHAQLPRASTSAPTRPSLAGEEDESESDISGKDSKDEFDPEKHAESACDRSSSGERVVVKRGRRPRSPNLTDSELMFRNYRVFFRISLKYCYHIFF